MKKVRGTQQIGNLGPKFLPPADSPSAETLASGRDFHFSTPFDTVVANLMHWNACSIEQYCALPQGDRIPFVLAFPLKAKNQADAGSLSIGISRRSRGAKPWHGQTHPALRTSDYIMAVERNS